MISRVRYDLSKAFSKVPEEREKNIWRRYLLGEQRRGEKRMKWFKKGKAARWPAEKKGKTTQERRAPEAPHERQLQEMFSKVFGFEMGEPSFPRDYEQLLVDRVLSLKAKSFTDACAEQEEIVRKLKEDPSLDPRTGLIAKELKDASMAIEAKKKDFWDSHTLAGIAGFSLKEKHGDYLL